MNTDISVISNIFLFSGADTATVEQYLTECSKVCYSSHDIIHSVSRQLNGIGVMLGGRARIVSGNGDTLLRILKRGDVFGAASVFSMEYGNRTEVIAVDDCSVLLIPKKTVMKIVSDDPDAAVRYITFLSGRIDFLNSRISALTAGDAVAKVAGYLLSLESDGNGHTAFGDSLTNVASRLNMGRASLYRTIDRFVSDGYITKSGNELVILDRDGLEDIIFKKKSGNSRQRKV